MLIDLTHSLTEKTPVYPGDPAPSIEGAGRLDADGYTDHVLHLGTHVGTHIDAPMHMISGGKSLADYSVNRFIGSGVLIDVRQGFNDITKLDQMLGGDIVLFWTGMSKNYHEESYFEDYDELPEDWVQRIVERRPKMVGFDQCSPDHPPHTVHKSLLSEDILIIENLANLDQLQDVIFRIVALPLNVSLDGSPARVVADVL